MGKHMVVGFAFRIIPPFPMEVVLVEKKRPDWQAGFMNGPGGKVEERETPEQAMRREFLEETGVDVGGWEKFATITHMGNTIDFFRNHLKQDCQVRTTTDEEVGWHLVRHVLTAGVVVPNLRWLIPMALDPGHAMAEATCN